MPPHRGSAASKKQNKTTTAAKPTTAPSSGNPTSKTDELTLPPKTTAQKRKAVSSSAEDLPQVASASANPDSPPTSTMQAMDIAADDNAALVPPQSMDTSTAATKTNKRSIERLLNRAEAYLKCEFNAFDPDLWMGLTWLVDTAEKLHNDLERTPDILVQPIQESLAKLVQMRQKLVALKPESFSLQNYVDKRSKRSFRKKPRLGKYYAKEFDLTKCVYCREKKTTDDGITITLDHHEPEHCTEVKLKSRSNRLMKRRLCFKCLRHLPSLPVDHKQNCEARCSKCQHGHHASLCYGPPKKSATSDDSAVSTTPVASSSSASTSAANPFIITGTPPIAEPTLPSTSPAEQLQVPMNIVHPTGFGVSSLMSVVGGDTTHYGPIVTVRARRGRKKKAFYGRAIIVSSSGDCFVSPHYLEQMGIPPTELAKPIPVQSGISNYPPVTAYAILEISSLYHTQWRFKQVFYVLNMSHYTVHMPSDALSTKAAAMGLQLSLNYDRDPTHNKLDFMIGRPYDSSLMGFEFSPSKRIELGNDPQGINAGAYYTHFGYLLTGTEKKKAVTEPPAPPKEEQQQQKPKEPQPKKNPSKTAHRHRKQGRPAAQ